MIARAVLLWFCILPLAIANGAFREAILAPCLGHATALFLSGLMLIALVFAFTLLTVRWLPPHQKRRDYLCVGALWLACTVAFEFLFGHFIAHHSWEKLCANYTMAGGNIWPVVLLAVAVSPYTAARLRRLI